MTQPTIIQSLFHDKEYEEIFLECCKNYAKGLHASILLKRNGNEDISDCDLPVINGTILFLCSLIKTYAHMYDGVNSVGILNGKMSTSQAIDILLTYKEVRPIAISQRNGATMQDEYQELANDEVLGVGCLRNRPDYEASRKRLVVMLDEYFPQLDITAHPIGDDLPEYCGAYIPFITCTTPLLTILSTYYKLWLYGGRGGIKQVEFRGNSKQEAVNSYILACYTVSGLVHHAKLNFSKLLGDLSTQLTAIQSREGELNRNKTIKEEEDDDKEGDKICHT